MKRSVLYLLTFAFLVNAYSQTEIFKSPQAFTAEQLSTFYASINADDSMVYFNAPDYQLYAFDKKTGGQRWQYALERKSDFPPFVSANAIWAVNRDKNLIKLDPATGLPLDTFAFSMETQPYFKNGLMYFTGILDGGCIIAYDPRADAVRWKRFLAHGYARRPYYLADKIIANAEGDNWIELNYDGTLKDKGCDKDALEGDFPSQLPCAKQFFLLTHDEKEIKGKLADQLFLNAYSVPETLTTTKLSFILNDGHLFILGNKGKLKTAVQLSSLSDELEDNPDASFKILHADDGTVSMLYSHRFIVYDHRNKKLLRQIDLLSREPHQALLDKDKLWFVSKKDGQLYGITLSDTQPVSIR